MANEDIKVKVAELRRHQRAIQDASAKRGEGWRHAVVVSRRTIGLALGELSTLITSRARADGMDAIRRAVSSLRAALAEHQSLWPAVSMDPADPAYVTSVERVRGAYTDLDTAVAGLDRPSRRQA